MRVVDNAAPDFAALQAKILAPGFPWYYARGTRENDGNTNPYLNGWVHVVYDHGHWYSQAGEFIVQQIIAMMGAVGEPIQSIYRIRIVQLSGQRTGIESGLQSGSGLRTPLAVYGDA